MYREMRPLILSWRSWRVGRRWANRLQSREESQEQS